MSVYAEMCISNGVSGCVWMLEDVYTCVIYTLFVTFIHFIELEL